MKIKKQKKQKAKKQFRWGVWLTVLSVFLGVSAIGGAAVLGVYLTGGFEEKIIAPESITFGYDENNYLEVEEDFKLTVTTETQYVTKDKVTLSFDSNVPCVTRKEGDQYIISNKIIEVPQTVIIGQPFTVHLLKERLTDEEGNDILENGNPVDWIVGGLSTLYAKSEAPNTINTKINIAVDVPVYATEMIVINSNDIETTQIVKNESFTVRTKFIPAKSEYIFSDNLRTDLTENQMRKKLSYYESVKTDKVTKVYDDIKSMHFVAGDEMVSEDVGVQINSYTFATAGVQLAQEAALNELGIVAPEDYHQQMIEFLAETATSKPASIKISIGEASIGTFTVEKNKISMNTEQPLRLFMNEYTAQSVCDYLGVHVYSTPAVGEDTGKLLDNLLPNIAINFQLNGHDATTGNNIALVVNGGKDYVEINGQRYYKPNAQTIDPRYSYWDISASGANEVTMNIVLLIEDGTAIFSKDDEDIVRTATLSISKHEEQALSWADQSDLNVLLDYDENGNVIPYTIDLNALTNIPEENIYQNYVFFASFGSGKVADYVNLAKKVFGEQGFDLERSGLYSTNSGNLELFAIDRSSINLYDASDFTLYYATIKDLQGQPLYDTNGLYQIAVLCAGYKRVSCEKALNDKSVSKGQINTANFPAVDNKTSINQGSDLTFSVIFTIQSEAVSVFRDEFQQGYMTPIIKDALGNDLSSYFLIDDGTFSINGETGEGKLEYVFKVKPAVLIKERDGIFFDAVTLKYNDGEDKDISWETKLITTGENAQIICIYKPMADKIELNGSQIYDAFQGQIQVNQALTVDGEFKTTITAGEQSFNSIEDFLNAFIGANGANLTITDQKGKTETLSGQWKFVIKEGDSSCIGLATDNKSFVFKDTASQDAQVKLIIQTLDDEAVLQYVQGEETSEFVIDFVINSTGVTKINYDTSLFTYANEMSAKTEETTSATISKYGAKGGAEQFIVLKNLVNFYVTDGETDAIYDKISFKFNTQDILEGSLSNEHLLDLFGIKVNEDGSVEHVGMLTLYSGEEESTRITFNGDDSASNIRSVLLSTEIYKIHINKDFAIEHPLTFIASDAIGAVKTSVSLNILANIIVSSSNYPATGALYAGANGATILTNKVTNHNNDNPNEGLTIKDLYAPGKYYVLYNALSNRYELTSQQPDQYDAIFDSETGEIIFQDFWDIESKEFRVFFQPEGDNEFAVNQPIAFTVTRDLVVGDGSNAVFHVLGDDSKAIDDFVQVTRHDGSKNDMSGLKVSYTFENYLDYDGNVHKKAGSEFFFPYNTQVLNTKLYITLEGQTLENALKVVDVEIRLYNRSSGNVYNDIANVLKSVPTEAYPTAITAQTQQVDSVDYVMIDITHIKYWSFGDLGAFKIKPSQKDYYGSIIPTTTFKVYSDLQVGFSSKALYFGLKDSTKYIPIKFYTNISDNVELATMHLPIIQTNIGYNTVVYNENIIESKNLVGHELETALTRPQELLEKGIYNEIEAGKVTQILKEIAYNESPAPEGGLYTPSGTVQTLNIYSLEKNYNEVVNSIQITKLNSKAVGYLNLNHLATSQKDVFIAFEYILEKDGNQQSYYYLLKVNPDIVVEDSIYAYDGQSQYLNASKDQVETVDLEETFANTTLHEGYKRFNVSKNINIIDNVNTLRVDLKSEKATLKLVYENDIDDDPEAFEITSSKEIVLGGDGGLWTNLLSSQYKLNVMVVNGDVDIYYNNEIMLSSLASVNEVVSVHVEGNEKTWTSQSDWASSLAVDFSSDYRYMTYSPLTDKKMTVTLKHTYQGGENSLAVIGAEQYYTFIINETSENYTVRFTDNTGIYDNQEGYQTVQETDNYKYIVENSKGAQEYNFTIQLIKIENAGTDTASKTIEYNKLDVRIKDTDRKYIESSSYDTSNGSFSFKTLDYIDSDKEITFTLYIEQGYLATMTVVLKANASVVSLKDSLGGGSTNAFADLFNVYLGEQIDDNKQILDTDFTITDVQVEGDEDYVNWNSNSIEVADLIANKEVKFTFTLTFGENKTYTFSKTWTLTANIKPISSYTSAEKVVAGGEHTIITTELYENDLLSNTEVELAVSSSSNAFAGVNGNIISTNHVSESVTVELIITVNLVWTKGEAKVRGQEYLLTYTFQVVPSASLSTNYPQPNDEVSMNFEYIEDGAIFTNIIQFIKSNPIFGNNSRIVVNHLDVSGNKTLVDLDTNPEVSVVIKEKENATLKYVEDETNIIINDEIDHSKQIVFNRGVSSSDSTILFRVTFEEVSVEYTVKILKNSLTMVLNPVTNNLKAGEKDGQSVSYEKIYVDKVSPIGLFDESRMVRVELNDSMTEYEGEYYFIFKEEVDISESELDTQFYASRATYISASDQGKNLYIDLGVSMAGKEFAGLYMTSDIEELKWNVTVGSPIKTNEKEGNEYKTLSQLPDSLINYANKIFRTDVEVENSTETIVPRVKLANRVQMVYGQLDGKDILVDYNYYKNIIIKDKSLEGTFEVSTTLDEISKEENLTSGSFARLDGSISSTEEGTDVYTNSPTWTLAYYYMPSLDIDVQNAISASKRSVQVEVNYEYPSIVSLLGIYHPTTTKNITPSNFMSSTDGLSFSVVDYETEIADIQDAKQLEILAKYVESYGSFKTYAKENTQNIYLFSSAIKNSNDCVCDYSLIPFGAKNTGDYVLGKLNYSSGGFTKTFYVVIKIVPDYEVIFGSSDNAGTEEDGQIISNMEIYTIAKTGGDYYSAFTLAGEDGYLSITHKNSSDKIELSAEEFNISLEENVIINSQKYNTTANLENKIFYSEMSDWESTEDGYSFKNSKYISDGSAETVEFTQVKKVIFGNQYYMLQGEDDYGYKFRLYFMLQATKPTPKAMNSIEIEENGYFDVGVQYDLLTITQETASDGTKTNHINPIPKTPTATTSVPLVNIEGIEAWLFDKDYSTSPVPGTEGDNPSYYIEKSDDGYNPVLTFSSEDAKYLKLSDISKVSITAINFYTANNPDPVLSATGGTTGLGLDTFATASEGEVYFNRMSPRAPFASTSVDENGERIETPGLWKVGNITQTDIYGGSNIANLTMLITLMYKDGDSIIEYYDLPVNVTVKRDITIEEERTTKVQRDGIAFAVEEQFNPKMKDGKELIAVDSQFYYLNDTLEILVPEHSTVSFELALTRDGQVINTTSVPLISNSSPYVRTEYRSLSQIFGVNVNEGDTVTISNISESEAKFYYITNTTDVNKTPVNGDGSATTFTISRIVNDVVYLEDASLISSTNYHKVTKHYILVTDFVETPAEGQTPEVYHYRTSKEYFVTGAIYKLSKNFTKEIGFALGTESGFDGALEVDTWAEKAFDMYQGSTTESGAMQAYKISEDPSTFGAYLFYTLDYEDDAGVMTMGKATIENDGTITLDGSFTTDQYIKVVIKMGVSGADRNIAESSDVSYIELATLNLSTVKR